MADLASYTDAELNFGMAEVETHLQQSVNSSMKKCFENFKHLLNETFAKSTFKYILLCT